MEREAKVCEPHFFWNAGRPVLKSAGDLIFHNPE